MRCKLAILYQPEGYATPLKLATVGDEDLIVAAAERAVRDAETATEELAGADPTLARLQQIETQRLRASLAACLPGFGLKPAHTM